jgi:Flp pilus assembly protein TadD
MLNRTSESNQAYYKALEITNKTLEADPRNATLWLGKGVLLNNVGNVQEAVKAFDNASRIDPKDEMAWMMKGVLLGRDLQRYDDAVKAYDSALQINPNDAQVWSLKGDALKALGRQAEADAAFAKAKELGYNVEFQLQAVRVT